MKTRNKQMVKHFSITKSQSLKPKNISHRVIKSPQCFDTIDDKTMNKTDQQLKWLQKLVTGFQWYKIKQDPLFDSTHNIKNQQTNKTQNKVRAASGCMRKNLQRFKQQEGKQQKKLINVSQSVPPVNSNALTVNNNATNKIVNPKNDNIQSNSLSKGDPKLAHTHKNTIKNKQCKQNRENQQKTRQMKINNYKYCKNRFNKIPKTINRNQNIQNKSKGKDQLSLTLSNKQNSIQMLQAISDDNSNNFTKNNQYFEHIDNIQICGIQEVSILNKDCMSIQKPKFSEITENSKKNCLKATRRNLIQNQVFHKNKNRKQESVNKFGKIVKNTKSVQSKNLQSRELNKSKTIKRIDIDNSIKSKVELDGPVTEPQIQSYYFQEKARMKAEHEKLKISIQDRLNFHKYHYCIEKKGNYRESQSLQNKQNLKKQRRLNSSVQHRTDNKNLQSNSPRINQQRKRCLTLSDTDKNSKILTNQQPTNIQKILQVNKNINVKQLLSSKKIPSEDQTKHYKKAFKQIKNGLPSLLDNIPGHQMKFAVSTKNSDIMNEQNSYVIQKIYDNSQGQPMELPNSIQQKKIAKDDYHGVPDWNVIEIFNKLDRKKNGILNSDNCSIQLLSRELRYIFGPILEQILYGKVQIKLNKFIQKIEQLLSTISCLKNKQQSSIYLQTKNLATQTKRDHVITADISLGGGRQQSLIFKKLSKSIDTITEDEESRQVTLKYRKNKNAGISQAVDSQKLVRFATFQNESDQQAITHVSPQKQLLNLKQRISQKSLELDLQQRLSQIGGFKSSLHYMSIDDRIRLKKNTQVSLISKQSNQSNQIQKLDLLNRKLQQYLINQSTTTNQHSSLYNHV